MRGAAIEHVCRPAFIDHLCIPDLIVASLCQCSSRLLGMAVVKQFLASGGAGSSRGGGASASLASLVQFLRLLQFARKHTEYEDVSAS